MELFKLNNTYSKDDFYNDLLHELPAHTFHVEEREEENEDEDTFHYKDYTWNNVVLFSYSEYDDEFQANNNWKVFFPEWNGKTTSTATNRYMLCRLLAVPVTLGDTLPTDINTICSESYAHLTFTPLINHINALVPGAITVNKLNAYYRVVVSDNCWIPSADRVPRPIHNRWSLSFIRYSNLENPQRRTDIPVSPPQERRMDEAPCEILGYSTKVETVIQVPSFNDTRYGIELELENATQENIQIIHNYLKKHAIMKRDGSLNSGVEIVSVPASIAKHKEIFKPFFDDENHSLEAQSNCGIHIHVTREKMSFLTLGRIMKFLAVNQQHVYKIAGRKSEHYAKVDPQWDLTSPWYAVNEDQKYRKNPRFNWSKYTGLNIAPGRTMEFRLFKSTTDYEEFCRFLEFTESIVDYCSLAGNDNKGKIKKVSDMFTFSNYRDFVAQRGKSYSALNKFLATI